MLKEIIWISRHWSKSFSPLNAMRGIKNRWFRFWEGYQTYKNLLSKIDKSEDLLENLYPCLDDNTGETYIDAAYFYQDWWAFNQIVQQQPSAHIDIGSHHKYVALLSTVIPLTMVDIRPLSLPLETLNFKTGSILDLTFEDNSVESLSSLCVVEHIGLGRYGDPLDPEGSEKAIRELKRVLKSGGYLYFSVPIVGFKNTTYFNAHRAFTEQYIEECFAPYQIVEKKYIYDKELVNERRDKDFGVGLYKVTRP